MTGLSRCWGLSKGPCYLQSSPGVDWGCCWTCMAARLLPLPTPISFPSLPQVVSQGHSLLCDWKANLHVRVHLPGNPTWNNANLSCFSPYVSLQCCTESRFKNLPLECNRDTKNGNYSLFLRGTYTWVGLGKDETNTRVWQNVPRVTNVTQNSSGNWIDWEVESLECQGRLHERDSIWVELRRVSRILIDFILSTVWQQLSPFRLVLLVPYPHNPSTPLESIIFWNVHLFPVFPLPLWCPHFTIYSA